MRCGSSSARCSTRSAKPTITAIRWLALMTPFAADTNDVDSTRTRRQHEQHEVSLMRVRAVEHAATL
jgi:hypothetical protein